MRGSMHTKFRPDRKLFATRESSHFDRPTRWCERLETLRPSAPELLTLYRALLHEFALIPPTIANN